MTTTKSIDVVKTVFRDWIDEAANNPKLVGYRLSVAANNHLSIELLFKHPEHGEEDYTT